MNIEMFERANGTFGVRNRIAVISTVACANHVAQLIANKSDLADAYTHAYGCDQLGKDLELSFNCLKSMGTHPNNGAVIVVGLGCEEILPYKLYDEIKKEQPNTEVIVIQENGGTTKSVELGTEIIKKFESIISSQKRVKTDISNLTLAIECGGSDYTSGIGANPALGFVTEKICDMGGKVVFGETAELMGAEEIIKEHSANNEVYNFVTQRINFVEKVAMDLKVDLRGTQPSPGNIEGGLTTIEEKSLGGICKIGKAKISDAIYFGEKAIKNGVTFVDTPGNDIACTLGLCTAGAQVVVFTTGRGTPMGFAAAPVIKVTANKNVAVNMAENVDVDLSSIVEGKISVEQGGEIIFNEILSVIEGKETATEKLGHKEFALYRISPIMT